MSHRSSNLGPKLAALVLLSCSACSLRDLDSLQDGAKPSSGGAGGTAGAAGASAGGGAGTTPADDAVYLGVLTPESGQNGWGPVEIDRSNGEKESGDGNPLSVAGKTWAKGLGTHAESTLSFHLGGKYTRFAASVGVDDEVATSVACPGSKGSVIFHVELDGAPMFASAVLTQGNAPSLVDLELEGAETLTLRVDDAGDGNECDHADWLAARVFPGAPPNDATPPVISDVVVTASAGGATLSWSTDDTAQGFVDYGIGAKLDQHADGGVWTRRHSVTLQGLTAGSQYTVRVGAKNRAGLSSLAPTHELAATTTGAPTIPPTAKLVTDFGAVPNDGKEDGPAILAAAASAGVGGVVGFPPGSYDVNSAPVLPSGRSYIGNQATLKGKGPDGHMLAVKGDDVSVLGLTLQGGGIFMDKPGGGFNQGIDISWNRFMLDTAGEHRSAITATSGLAASKITNNHFSGYGGSFGIYGYNYDGLTIANNEFVDIGAAMHIDAFGSSGNLLVEQNYIKGAKGMGMEFQGTAENLTFQDNWFEHPNLSSDPTKNGNSMAFSLILDKSKHIVIRRNVVIAPERPDGTGCRIGFELGGDNSVAEDNYIDGINHVAAMNDGVGTASVKFNGNRMKDYLQAPSCSFCKTGVTFEAKNNGPNVALTWDIGRGPPSIGKRY